MRVIVLPNRLNITLTLLCIRMYYRSIVGQSSEGHVIVAWPSSTYIHVYMNERERGERENRENLPHASYGHRHVVSSAVLLAGVYASTAKPALSSGLRCQLPRVGDRQGQLVYEYGQSSHWPFEFMLCGLYLWWGRERGRERERERGGERERERERERESTLQDHVRYNTMKIALCVQTQSCIL